MKQRKSNPNAWKIGRKGFQVGLSSLEAAKVVIAKDALKVKTDRELLMGLIAGLPTPADRKTVKRTSGRH